MKLENWLYWITADAIMAYLFAAQGYPVHRRTVSDLPDHRGVRIPGMAAPVPAAGSLSAPPDWALARVPGLSEGAAARRIERLGGGTVNEVYRVDSSWR